MSTVSPFEPVNVCATRQSGALSRNDGWLRQGENERLILEQIAPGFTAGTQYDLAYFSGNTIASGRVVPVYVGGDGTQAGGAATWSAGDIGAIDGALAQVFADAALESVIAQYFPTRPTLTVDASAHLTDQATSLQQSDVETMVSNAFSAGTLTGDPAVTLYCLMLSEGTELFASDGSNSHNGLGGYHGSVTPSSRQTVYYAVGVYSETKGGVTNGIPAFPSPWQNVVATFYHEINEWRTDPDVEKAQGSNVTGVLGWYNAQYGEIGDIPIVEAGSDLSKVFVEVSLANGSGQVPVQLMYSNFDHGPAASTAAPVGSARPQSTG